MNVTIHTRPLETWPRPFTEERWRAPFKMSWDKTLRLLKKELAHLEASTVILQVAMPERDISVTTGMPRGDRSPEHPGVIVAADTKFGALKWVCDEFLDWRHNVHAIALTLSRLRLADLYGVTRRGEQYSGWKMLPGPITVAKPSMSMEEAARFLAAYGSATPAEVLGKRAAFERANRAAAKKLHPDTANHDPSKWQQYQEAASLLNNFHARR